MYEYVKKKEIAIFAKYPLFPIYLRIFFPNYGQRKIAWYLKPIHTEIFFFEKKKILSDAKRTGKYTISCTLRSVDDFFLCQKYINASKDPFDEVDPRKTARKKVERQQRKAKYIIIIIRRRNVGNFSSFLPPSSSRGAISEKIHSDNTTTVSFI